MTLPDQIAHHVAAGLTEREQMIEDYVSECRECGSREFPKRRDCDGCTAAVDEELARRAIVAGER